MQEARTRAGWLGAAALYTLGNVVVAVAVGAVVGAAGGAILGPLAGKARLAVPAVVYTLVGLFALAYALVEFGWLRLPVPGLHADVPLFVHKLRFYPRSFLLGAVVGGGFTVGCPFPTYHVILGWIAATGSPLMGALVLGTYGVGRAFPVFLVGTALFAGAPPQTITRWVRERAPVAHLINGLGLTLLASFLIAYWGLLLTLRVLVR